MCSSSPPPHFMCSLVRSLMMMISLLIAIKLPVLLSYKAFLFQFLFPTPHSPHRMLYFCFVDLIMCQKTWRRREQQKKLIENDTLHMKQNYHEGNDLKSAQTSNEICVKRNVHFTLSPVGELCIVVLYLREGAAWLFVIVSSIWLAWLLAKHLAAQVTHILRCRKFQVLRKATTPLLIHHLDRHCGANFTASPRMQTICIRRAQPAWHLSTALWHAICL